MTMTPATVCGVHFERLCDGASVVCVLAAGHACAHAFGPDVVEKTEGVAGNRSAASVRRRRRYS